MTQVQTQIRLRVKYLPQSLASLQADPYEGGIK
jgi:hypothetical protein